MNCFINFGRNKWAQKPKKKKVRDSIKDEDLGTIIKKTKSSDKIPYISQTFKNDETYHNLTNCPRENVNTKQNYSNKQILRIKTSKSNSSSMSKSSNTEFELSLTIEGWSNNVVIGRGSGGIIYRGLLNGSEVAMKVLAVNKEDKIKKFSEELNILVTLNKQLHARLPKYISNTICPEGPVSYICIFMEYFPKGSISEHLKKSGPIHESKCFDYMDQILDVLNYIHGKNIIHCDIKCANLLLDNESNIKLIDFGCSIQGEFEGGMCGTESFMAPEVINLKVITGKADIWSLGCTLIEMLTGKLPWNGCNKIESRINKSPPIQDNFSDKTKAFLKRCFMIEPEERPSASELRKLLNPECVL